MATVKEVAQLAGVSVATVSKYMNGGNVREPYRAKVESAVRELGYVINEAARTLKTKKTNMIGILTAEIGSSFTTSVISIIQRELLNMGYTTLILDYQADRKLESRQLDVLLRFNVDGIILFPIFNEAYLVETIRKNKIPLLLVDNEIYGEKCAAVVTNNRKSAYCATKRLIECNHVRIALCRGTEETYTAEERFKGYMDAMAECGLPPIVVNGYYSVKGGYRAVKQLAQLSDVPTAVISCNYNMTIGMLRALYELNWRIPEDISVVAFDEQLFDFALPVSISAIIQPIETVGVYTARRIVEMIGNESLENTSDITVIDSVFKETGSFRVI